MQKGNLSTDSYKGVRDFYPEDAAIQQYIFSTWAKTAEQFGFERYDASLLEASELYRSKGAVNEEMVNEQTYTFTDRGDREVTLRPEMTPTVARMVAGRRRDLKFPVRWYSIPNLFRYERPQRGRLREHWQLNCDLFGVDDFTADVEIIALAHQVLIDFGANPAQFEIRLNNRAYMSYLYTSFGISDTEAQNRITRLNDRFHKITTDDYLNELTTLVGDKALALSLYEKFSQPGDIRESEVARGLLELGINNVIIDYTLARGFDYYTGTIFEIFDMSGENNRSLIGGGRYDNLTALFSDEPISGIGFGMGDVTMRDFLTTHNLLPSGILCTAPLITIIPTDPALNLEAQKLAATIRKQGLRVTTDIGNKKIGKKIADAAERGVLYSIVVGSDELTSMNYTLKNLEAGTTESGTLENLLTILITTHKPLLRCAT